MHNPLLNSFFNLFKICKLKCVNSIFSNAIYKLCRVNSLGQTSIVTCSRRNFMGGSCPRLVVHGEIIHRKMSWGQKSREQLPWGKLMEEGNCLRGHYSRVIVLGVKVWGEFYEGKLSVGQLSRRKMSGYHKNSLTSYCVRYVSSNQVLHKLNKTIQFIWLIMNLLCWR